MPSGVLPKYPGSRFPQYRSRSPNRMFRSSVSPRPDSVASINTAPPSYSELPRSPTQEHSAAPASPTSRHRRNSNGTSSHKSASSSATLTASTSSRTRERLRQLEAEHSELRRIAEHERAVAERLKLEGATKTALSASDLDSKIRDLKLDAKKAEAESQRRPTSGIFKAACSSDLLFLIDTTSSMQGHIQAAKDQVKSIVNDIKTAFLNDAEVRMAVVGYKDHQDTPNIQFLDFTSSADEVRSFIDGLSATGGGDLPEDVLGGINKALNASWQQQTRCIIHIADAPPHGRIFSDMPYPSDTYPNAGSEPHRLHYDPLLRQMIALSINYCLLRINSSTDKMAFMFYEKYAVAKAECKLHTLNRHYKEACEMSHRLRASHCRSRGSSARSNMGSLLFEEKELGTSFASLRHMVVKAVTGSASRTAVRMLSSPSRTSKALTSKLDSGLGAIEEDEDGDNSRSLEVVHPQWNNSSWLNETLMAEGFSPDVVVHGATTLDDMMAHDDNIKMSVTELTIRMRSKPFAQGAMRTASYAKTAASTNRFVVKSYKRGGKRLAHVAEDMRCQALCKAFALEFNALSGEYYSIDFITTTCLKGKLKPGMGSADECMSLEPFIEGTYVKYNNNCGYVKEDTPSDRFNKAAQAFSHFTFERSKGRFLVSDLQGVDHLLTDPAIHTKDPERFKLTDTNLGTEGFKFFFASHVCNGICTKLGLKSNSSMLMSGAYTFREEWPSTVNNTICCSNKLCGRIIRASNAKKDDTYPGYRWCDTCFPQLRSTIVRWLCTSPGPDHEFEASKFFYESQGRSTPRMCLEHRGDDGLGVVHMPMVTAPAGKQGRTASMRMPEMTMVSSASAPVTRGRSSTGSKTRASVTAGTPVAATGSTSVWKDLKFATVAKKNSMAQVLRKSSRMFRGGEEK